eukprot:CAMPEP_0177670638 /NCGR_PEP_ID=MMETSP0447-20121125/24206_1 /TAXON_ID=0 /ORGANISM="Stygamoeba regulata, Strain BSH-02190019" /LENGTH=144 /DNA_ID=CAMNT_0019177835 /DNA_START=25 /DNA_END=459 /DNA_ORIENTATION=-
MVGHSGDSACIPLIGYNEPPKNRMERYRVLERIVAHTQFCMSGDHTLEAIEDAVEEVTSVEGDEHFVFVLSDANLRRYGISPAHLAQAMKRNPKVKVHAIFIASLGEQSRVLEKNLPPGAAFTCLDTHTLPGVFHKLLHADLAR